MNFYKEQGEKILNGIKAENLKELKDYGKTEEIQSRLWEVSLRAVRLVVKVKVVQDKKTNTIRVSYMGVDKLAFNFKQENKQLLKRLRIYKRKERLQPPK